MAQADTDLRIEPGKQLPQTLNVKADDKGDAQDVAVRYLLFVPKDYKPKGKKWPLMLFLHGRGECSTDNLDFVKMHGPPKIVETKPDFPFVLISPQSPPPEKGVGRAWKPDELIQLVDHIDQQSEHRSRPRLRHWPQHGRLRHVASRRCLPRSLRSGCANLWRRRPRPTRQAAQQNTDLGLPRREGYDRSDEGSHRTSSTPSAANTATSNSPSIPRPTTTLGPRRITIQKSTIGSWPIVAQIAPIE